MANKNRRKAENLAEKQKQAEDKKTAANNVAKLLVSIAVVMIIFGLYRFLIKQYYFEIVLIIYMAVAAAVILTYVIYNRGFSRRGLSADMLPREWSDEQKKEFIEDGERRLVKSRPLIVLIFAFAFTFVVDILELYALPLIQQILGR